MKEEIIIREFKKDDIKDMIYIWNEVVLQANAFPQIECLNEEEGFKIFQKSKFYCRYHY